MREAYYRLGARHTTARRSLDTRPDAGRALCVVTGSTSVLPPGAVGPAAQTLAMQASGLQAGDPSLPVRAGDTCELTTRVPLSTLSRPFWEPSICRPSSLSGQDAPPTGTGHVNRVTTLQALLAQRHRDVPHGCPRPRALGTPHAMGLGGACREQRVTLGPGTTCSVHAHPQGYSQHPHLRVPWLLPARS